jgi:hypothetical protein
MAPVASVRNAFPVAGSSAWTAPAVVTATNTLGREPGWTGAEVDEAAAVVSVPFSPGGRVLVVGLVADLDAVLEHDAASSTTRAIESIRPQPVATR